MLASIVRFSIKNKLFVCLTTLFLLIGGVYAMLTLPIDAVPDITNNQVQIVTVSLSLAPQEVEQLITFPIEVAMSNIMNVVEIRSVSRFGLSLVTVVFKDHVKTLVANQQQDNLRCNTFYFNFFLIFRLYSWFTSMVRMGDSSGSFVSRTYFRINLRTGTSQI
jgi:hypothetical protein